MKLRNALKCLGSSSLAELVGQQTLEAVDAILNESITEGRMVDLLLERNGSQILKIASIRRAVLSVLDKEDIAYIHYGDRAHSISDDIREKSISWSRSNAKAVRLIECLELDESYLPPETEKIEPTHVASPLHPLHEYQKRIKDRALDLIGSPSSRLLIHMPTGAGKTKTSAELLVDFWRTKAKDMGYIIWLAHSEELCAQAEETLSLVWSRRGDYPLPVYRLWGSIDLPEQIGSNGIVVASLQRMYSLWTSQDKTRYETIYKLKHNSRIVVIDEAHKAIAPTYKDAIEALTNLTDTRVLGLTATPGRGHDPLENQRLAAFFKNSKITLQDNDGCDLPNPIGYLQEQDFLAKIHRRKIPTNIDIDLTPQEKEHLERFLELPLSVISKLGESQKRNALIISEIARLNDEGYTVIVFACSVEHARMLADLCRIRGIMSRSIDGQTAEQDRRLWLEQYKRGDFRTLINFGVLTTGFDAPNTNAVLITRPTSSLVLYSQMIGRGIRGKKMGGNEECLLVDIEDNLRDFPSEAQAFTHFTWS